MAYVQTRFRHHDSLPSAHAHARHHGWTLVELMLVVAVVGTLAMVALPSWQAQVNKVRRMEAIEALHHVSLAQERWRASHPSYADNLGSQNGLALATAPSAASYLTASGHYRVSIQTDASSARHRHAATATAQGAMTNDTLCRSLSLSVDAGVTAQGAVPAVNTQRCWGR